MSLQILNHMWLTYDICILNISSEETDMRNLLVMKLDYFTCELVSDQLCSVLPIIPAFLKISTLFSS
jgi:hypothetical protein